MSAILSALAARAAETPNAIALSSGDTILSWRSFANGVATLADELASKLVGIDSAQPVAIDLPNGIEWVIADLALIKLGRPSLPLPQFFTPEQRTAALADAGAAAIIGGDFVDGDCVMAGRVAIRLATTGLSRADLPEGTAKITYTSGSTASPKGICLSLAHLEQVAASLVDVIGASYAGRHVAVLPLGVLLENVAGLYTVILAGGHYDVPCAADLGLADAFRPDFPTLARQLAEGHATSAILVPELLRGLIGALRATGCGLPDMQLLAVGGSKLSPALLQAAQAIGLPVRQGYGLSECASVVALNTPLSDRIGSVGRVLPHLKVEIASDGEIIVQGPVMLGTVGVTRPAGPLATGDIGRIDSDGYLFIEGRKSNLLITGFGRNVSPEWIESELLAEPAIGQALAFGDGQAALGALLVPSSATVRQSDLVLAVGRVNGRLPAYAQIDRWSRVPPFTADRGLLTGNGRPRREPILKAWAELVDPVSNAGTLPFFDRLRLETQAEQAALFMVPQIQAGLTGTISRSAYIAYLGEAYHHVKHTVPLMQAARARLPEGKSFLIRALDEYIAEETGHEHWILSDIRNAGGNAEAVRNGQPNRATQAMVDHAYAFIRDVNPAGFFGMVYVLEGTSTMLATRGATAVQEALGLPANCFSYLTSHGALDLDHMKFFETLVNRLDDPDDRRAVIDMAKAMFGLFADMFRGIPLTEELSDAT